MKNISTRFAAVALVSAFILSACEEFEALTAGDTDTTEASAELGAGEPRTAFRDVERSDIFSVSENGLWDGRPSLGGIWVAHPDVTDPERAKITNTKNNQTIEGALFRRERDNPGPRIQVSSDAAKALGLLAGQPTELVVVAVRQEEIELEPEPLPIATEDGTDAEAATEPALVDDSSDGGAAAVAGTGAAIASDDASTPQRQGFWARFRDSLRNKPKEAPAEAPLAESTTDSTKVPEVETAPLDAVTSAAAAAIANAEASTDRPPERPSAETAATGDGLQNPYVQVGLFSQEDNASAAAASLRQAGIVPQIRGQKSGDKTLWRVFVGPAETTKDQAALLRQVRALGYQDAYLSPN